jgi:hypothetical protein
LVSAVVQLPAFKADVITQWNALKRTGVFTTWLAAIQQQAKNLEQSQANNFGRWPMQGIEVWPNAEAAGGYNREIDYFINWLNLRIAYLDSLFNTKAQTDTTLMVVAGINGSPVTSRATVTGGTAPTGVVSFLSNGILLGAASLNKGSAALTSNLPSGTNNVQAVYNGDQNNALSISSVLSVIAILRDCVGPWAPPDPRLQG